MIILAHFLFERYKKVMTRGRATVSPENTRSHVSQPRWMIGCMQTQTLRQGSEGMLPMVMQSHASRIYK